MRMVGTNFLCQCSYISRLMYETDPKRIEKMLRHGLELSPDAFNASLRSGKRCGSVNSAILGEVRFVRNRQNLKAMITRRHSKNSAFHAEDCTVVAFKGTDTVLDVLQDLRGCTSCVDERLPRVHSGFSAMLKSSVSDIASAVEAVRGTTSRLIVTGHSMGGALADIFSRIIAMDAPGLDVVCVTFGQPKIWSAPATSEPKNHAYYRVANAGDCVCSLPPWLLHQRSRELYCKPKVLSRWVLGRFENRPGVEDYKKHVASLNATPAGLCDKVGGGHGPSCTMSCNWRASLGVCHGVYMDVGYMDVLKLHRYRSA